jgi:hypothetical protein
MTDSAAVPPSTAVKPLQGIRVIDVSSFLVARLRIDVAAGIDEQNCRRQVIALYREQERRLPSGVGGLE